MYHAAVVVAISNSFGFGHGHKANPLTMSIDRWGTQEALPRKSGAIIIRPEKKSGHRKEQKSITESTIAYSWAIADKDSERKTKTQSRRQYVSVLPSLLRRMDRPPWKSTIMGRKDWSKT